MREAWNLSVELYCSNEINNSFTVGISCNKEINCFLPVELSCSKGSWWFPLLWDSAMLSLLPNERFRPQPLNGTKVSSTHMIISLLSLELSSDDMRVICAKRGLWAWSCTSNPRAFDLDQNIQEIWPAFQGRLSHNHTFGTIKKNKLFDMHGKYNMRETFHLYCLFPKHGKYSMRKAFHL